MARKYSDRGGPTSSFKGASVTLLVLGANVGLRDEVSVGILKYLMREHILYFPQKERKLRELTNKMACAQKA